MPPQPVEHLESNSIQDNTFYSALWDCSKKGITIPFKSNKKSVIIHLTYTILPLLNLNTNAAVSLGSTAVLIVFCCCHSARQYKERKKLTKYAWCMQCAKKCTRLPTSDEHNAEKQDNNSSWLAPHSRHFFVGAILFHLFVRGTVYGTMGKTQRSDLCHS